MVRQPQEIVAMDKKEKCVKAGAAGGKATGATKRRNMSGVKVGRNSAGRAAQKPPGFGEPRRDSFRDVFFACVDWLSSHEDPWLKYEFMPTNPKN